MLKSTMMKDYEDFTPNDVWNYTTNSSENHSHIYFSDYTPPDGEDYEYSYQRKLITYYLSGCESWCNLYKICDFEECKTLGSSFLQK